jgi:hypothetical protein
MQLNLKEGDRFIIRMVMDQQISSKIEGQKEDILQKIGFSYTYNVTGIDPDGNISVQIVYDWVLLEQESAYGKVEFDSSSPPEVIPPEAEGYNALLGKGFSMVMTSQGEIIEINGLNEMYSEMIDDLGITDEAERQQMEQLIHDQFGEEALKEQMGNIMMKYPEGPVMVGDTWTQSGETSIMTTLIIETTYSLSSYEEGVAIFDAKSTITPHPDMEIVDFGYAKIGYSLSGEQEGKTIVDTNTGLTLNGSMTQTLTGEMTIIMDDEELTVPISIFGTTTIEMVMEE